MIRIINYYEQRSVKQCLDELTFKNILICNYRIFYNCLCLNEYKHKFEHETLKRPTKKILSSLKNKKHVNWEKVHNIS